MSVRHCRGRKGDLVVEDVVEGGFEDVDGDEVVGHD